MQVSRSDKRGEYVNPTFKALQGPEVLDVSRVFCGFKESVILSLDEGMVAQTRQVEREQINCKK